jgi:crotonobetainyl-CoA:carnitine CoA-transferase CaiB-like acyl-CoA transferase
MMTERPALPCAGVSVVEVAVGITDLGFGLAGGAPGMLLAGLGADVVRVVGTGPPAVDEEVAWGRIWHADKRLVRTEDQEEIAGLLRRADVALIYGNEAAVERRGLGYDDICRGNPDLVYARCRPSRTSTGTVEDFTLLVEARAGFCTQLAGHRPGPIFVDARTSAAGTSFLLTTSVLALLERRARGGTGGWTETSLYDGMLATLGCMVGRSERAAPNVERYWAEGSTFPNFVYRCADDQLVQVWFGGKGMYAALIEVLGDEPSEEGYYQDQVNGALQDRAVRWRSLFAKQPREHWIERLRRVGVACEPVLLPGEVLADPHLAEVGLAVHRSDSGHDEIAVGSPISVRPLGDGSHGGESEALTGEPASARQSPAASAGGRRSAAPGQLLTGLRVLDFSAFVAGPLGAQVLADLGADVIKVEPPEGETMRAAAYAMAACQRGKRSLAIDVRAEEARPVVERLLRWADVVLHNFRVGVPERLGIDERTVARLNPSAVYCHASAFGTTGPRATFPGNDALMQAVTGLELAVGGAGNDPLAPTWIPIDMAGGWLTAIGILAGLYARARSGRGQRVQTSLLGAGMLLQSGIYERDGECLRQPELDGNQTGYGPGYRIFQGSDGAWFALVIPDDNAWRRVRALPGAAAMPATYAPLRDGFQAALARKAEQALEGAFVTRPAREWVQRLGARGVPAELVEPMSRDDFRQGILDDPVNRQLGRVASFETADWGHFEQIGGLFRFGPEPVAAAPQMLPGVGEHSVDVLVELGFDTDDVNALLGAKVVRQL